MRPELVVLVLALAAGIGLSVLKVRYDGRFRGPRAGRTRAIRGSVMPSATQTTGQTAGQATGPERVTAEELGAPLGDRATLLQFSSAFCSPCRATRRVLAEVEAMVDGVRHIEVDAESHLELVRRLNVLRTPTTLVLDATGATVTRASGAPRKEQVIAALGAAVDRQTG